MKRVFALKFPFLKRRCLIMGDENEVQAITAVLTNYPFFDVVCSGDNHGSMPSFEEAEDPGSLMGPHGIDEIILGETADSSPETRNTLIRFKETGVTVTPVSLLYESLTGRIPVDSIDDRGGFLVSPNGAGSNRVYSFVKRCFDVIGASLGLLLLCLIFPCMALAIKFNSPGPIFFRQERVGMRGEIFVIRKLRTMVADAEKDEAIWSNHHDTRVMRLGRWLRKSRLDEIPQCWNILKGEMSIVGPRPERIKVVEKLEKELPLYHLRHMVKPGLAGWAMVNRGYMCSFEDAKVRLEHDLYYVKHQSLWFDALIFLRAFWHLLAMKGK
jgi:exopolysaccharide biosynthesis polyprenyl glycosylphosphotransferase